MDNNRPHISFRDFLNVTGLLVCIDGAIQGRYTHNGQFLYQDFTTAELLSIDSRLPAVMRCLFFNSQHERAEPGVLVALEWVRHTLSLWETPKLLLDTTNKPYYLKSVFELSGHSIDTDVATLVVDAYKIWKIDDISYTTNTRLLKLEAEGVQLDSLYPGWRGRREVANSLQLAYQDQAPYIFTQDPYIIESNISDVTFE